MPLLSFLAAALAGVCGAMGFGSGTVLLLYLTLCLSVDQQTAQGINLLFFLPTAAVALIVYLTQHSLPLRRAGGLLLCALPGAALGYAVTTLLPVALLRRLFGAFLILLALKEFISLKKKRLTAR